MMTSVGCVSEFLSEQSLFVTYCDEAATPAQWSAYLKLLRSMKGRDSTRFLVYAQVVPPREMLTEIASTARGERWTIALISPSVAVRFAASTFALVVKGFRFFAPDAIGDALHYLGQNDAQTEQARQALDNLRGIATATG